MDNNEIYYEQEEEVSVLGKLWSLIKLSWKNILVFCIVAAIAMVGVSAIVLLTTNNDSAYVGTVISYSYSGIEQGLAPSGGVIDTGKIKSSQVVGKAIESLKEQDLEISAEQQTEIINSITIEGVVDNKVLQQIVTLNELSESENISLANIQISSLYPSVFLIKYNKSDKNTFSDSTIKRLLDEITKQYIEQFRKEYLRLAPMVASEIVVTETNASEVLAKYDYIDILNILDRNVAASVSYLNARISEAPSYQSATYGLSFNDLRTSFNNISTMELAKLETTIVNNGITKDFTQTADEISHNIYNITADLEEAEKNAAAYEKAIGEYKNGQNIIVGPSGEITVDGSPTETYNNLYNNYMMYTTRVSSLQKELARAKKQLAAYQDENGVLIDNPKNTEANQKIAIAQAQAASVALNNLITKANAIVTEYANTVYLSSAVRLAVPATTYIPGGTSNFMLMLVISALVVIAAAIAALIFSNAKLKKVETKKARAPKAKSQTHAPQEAYAATIDDDEEQTQCN